MGPISTTGPSAEAVGCPCRPRSWWFSSLDLGSYWQVKLALEDRPRTAFTIGKELWQFWLCEMFCRFGAPEELHSDVGQNCERWHLYLYKQCFPLLTGHQALTMLLSASGSGHKPPHVHRWGEA
ncbi:unnamed protein product [Merluccius merluccius]